jgi:outer membrane protein TolC
MVVREVRHFALTRRVAWWRAFVFLGFAGAAVFAHGQVRNPSSATNPFYGSVTLHPADAEVVKLSLDDAIHRGLETNLGLKEAESGEKVYKGEKNIALQQFLPSIDLSGDTGYYQHNLAALGFRPGIFGDAGSVFPGGVPEGFSEITENSLTQGKVSLHQTLFSGPVIAGWKAAGAAQRSAYFAKMTARGEVVQQVATAYLRCIADASNVDNATALETQDKVLLDQAHQAHLAGTVANLDELRARVQLQDQQQQVISAQNALEKDLILLKREIGLDSAQKIILTDPAPYSELSSQTPEEVRATAYKNRQDYQNLQAQVDENKAIHAAYRAQRLPSLSFNGYYGVDKVNGVPSRGLFMAMGTLSMPIFREASLRGQSDAAAAQLASVNAQLDDLREKIDQQVRSALLDVGAATQLVSVAKSNVDLATLALSDETERVNAGVDDNLALVTAQARLAAAQTNYVQSLYRFNLAKLGLARAAGVIELQYRAYLGQ